MLKLSLRATDLRDLSQHHAQLHQQAVQYANLQSQLLCLRWQLDGLKRLRSARQHHRSLWRLCALPERRELRAKHAGLHLRIERHWRRWR
jgi:hypothetical protein